MHRTCGGGCCGRIAYVEEFRDLRRKKKATYRMPPVSEMTDEQTPRPPERTPMGRVVIWGFLVLALVIGIVLYFIYERRIASVL
jgi:hypothetical protein